MTNLRHPCVCNVYTDTGSGGVLWGGSATFDQNFDCGSGGVVWGGAGDTPDTTSNGGVVFGGVGRFAVPAQLYDRMVNVLPLDDAPMSGSANRLPFKDHTNNGNGVGSGSINSGVGVNCLECSLCAGNCGVRVPEHLASTSPFSVSLWARVAEVYPARNFITRGDYFSLGAGNMAYLVASLGDATLYSEDTLIPDRWYHVAATWDGSTLAAYLDGVLVGSVPAPPVTAPAGAILIGSQFSGSLQEVRVYSGALDASWWAAELANFCSQSFYSVSES